MELKGTLPIGSAASLTPEQEQLIRADALLIESGNMSCSSFSKIGLPYCKVCSSAKHHVKWGELRYAERLGTTKVRGGLCYTCVRARLSSGCAAGLMRPSKRQARSPFGKPVHRSSGSSSSATTVMSVGARIALPLKVGRGDDL